MWVVLKPAGAKPLPEVWCSLSAWAVSLSPRLQAAPPAHTVFAVNSWDTSFYKLTCDPVSLSVPGTSPSRPLACHNRRRTSTATSSSRSCSSRARSSTSRRTSPACPSPTSKQLGPCTSTRRTFSGARRRACAADSSGDRLAAGGRAPPPRPLCVNFWGAPRRPLLPPAPLAPPKPHFAACSNVRDVEH